MEYRSQKTAIRLLSVAAGLMLASLAAGQSVQFDVRHGRALKDHPGRLTFDERGVQYQQVLTRKQEAKVAKGKKAPKLQTARWDYDDIQQLWVSPEKLVIVTYKDRKWFLGVDKEFEFFPVAKASSFSAAYEMLKGKLDQRFVAALADDKLDPVWQIPAKLLGAIQGSEGTLRIGTDHIVYSTARKGESRTWRLDDIENLSTSGPFQLTLTTYERAKLQYGSMRVFNFQLKHRLDNQRFELLWKRHAKNKGLEFLTSIQERSEAPR